MKKYFSLSLAAFLLSASMVSAAALTQQQIDAITGLLRSFGADASVVANVESSLGGASSQSSVAPVMPPPAASQQQEMSSAQTNSSGEGRPFTATSNLNVRSDPGGGVTVATVPAGSEGLIYGEPFRYNLRTWEYVVFDAGPQGWVATEFGTKVRSSRSPFPAHCYAGTWPAPGSGGCLANADGASYSCGGATYRKPTLSPCSISAPETVYYNEPFTISVTGGTDQSISVGEWRGPLSPAMCPSRLTNCTGNTCTLEATATQPGTLFVGFFTNKPAPGGINVYGPTCRKTIRAMVRPAGTTPPPPAASAIVPPPPAASTGLVVPPPPPAASTGLIVPPPPLPPPAARLTTPPPPIASCINNWNSSNGGYYQKPGTSCPCQYFTATGGQPIGPAAPSSCSPVTLPPPPPPATGLNLSPQRFGSPQSGQILWVRADTLVATDTGVYVYTGTNFPVASEGSLSTSYNGGTIRCQSSWMTRDGMLVTSSGGNSTVFKLNGQSEEDGLFVWWRGVDGSYDWRQMTIDEYRAENRTYDVPGRGSVPYAPNCVLTAATNVSNIPLSHYFQVGDRVELSVLRSRTGSLDRSILHDIRSGPAGASLGSEAPISGSQPAGALGCIVDGRVVNLSAGDTWYNVDFDSGSDGWMKNRFRKVGTCSVSVPPPPPPAPLPPPPAAPLVLGMGASIRIKALPESTAGVNYRNDPLLDGSCGTVDGEESVGARGTIIGARNVCTTDGRVRWKIRFTSGAEGWVTQNRLEVVSPTSRVPSISDPAIANTLDGLRRSIESLQNLIGQH